ncbi:MAG: replicative DNA helicase [candidate division SR1 bacterium CG_4_9_14_3_um_filter_40_9]|nr:MAG: replicative DNA helicase [candidate division SR1 bacterium CG_4_9_14_3_um_filter_40_9]
MISLEDIKLPPHNLDAEKGAICGILMENELMYICEGITLIPEDFYNKEHAFIYKAIKDLRTARKTIDVLTVADQLGRDDKLDVVGGTDYLYEISSFLLSFTGADEYVKIVKEKSILRNILKTCQKIIGDVYDQKDTFEVLQTIEKRIFDLTQNNLSETVHSIKEILDKRVEEYMEMVDNPDKLMNSKVHSGYFGLDDLLGGFKPGELIIVAARPSMGKTAFAINVLEKMAVEQKRSVAMFSLEMASEQIVDRILSMVARIPMYKITKGNLDSEDFSNMGEAMETLSGSKIFIDDKGSSTIPQLKSKIRRLKIKESLDLVIVDYLQLMSGASTGYSGNRVQEIGEISRGLKELARELEIPIIALSQLSREVEKRVDKKPQLSDLRESGAIEQDADAVLMLHREDYYDPDTDKKGLTDICLRKNRNGPIGEVELYFEKEIMKFSELPSKKKTDGTY